MIGLPALRSQNGVMEKNVTISQIDIRLQKHVDSELKIKHRFRQPVYAGERLSYKVSISIAVLIISLSEQFLCKMHTRASEIQPDIACTCTTVTYGWRYV